MPKATEKKGIIVLGMHRSGTSMVTRLLNLHGVSIAEDLAESNEYNEKGYWESRTVQAINDEILTTLASSWFECPGWSRLQLGDEEFETFVARIVEFFGEAFGDAPGLFAVKDPRIVNCFSVWREAFDRFGAEVSVVLPFRNPLEVADSLENRDGIRCVTALRLWLAHVLEAEKLSREFGRSFVSFPDLLEDWRSAMERVGSDLGIEWPRAVEDIAKEADAFVSPSLNHHSRSVEDLEKAAGADHSAVVVYRTLLEAVREAEAPDSGSLDAVRAELSALQAGVNLGVGPHIAKYVRPAVHRKLGPAQLKRVIADRFALRETLAERIEQQRRLGDVLGNRRADLDELRVRSIELRKKRDALGADLDARTAELEEARERIESSRLELERRAGEIAGLESDLERTIGQLEDARAEIREREKDLLYQSETLFAMRDDVAAHLEAEQQRARESRNLQARIAAQSLRMDELAAQLHGRWSELNSLGALARHFRRRLSEAVNFRVHRKQYLKRIEDSGAFDAEWYRKHHRDLPLEDGGAALAHYLASGAFEGRRPGPYFDSAWYLEQNSDVAGDGVNPLLHYLYHGAAEGRDPNPWFSTRWYLNRNPEVAESGENPLTHFIFEGDLRGLAPSPRFDGAWYLNHYADVAASGLPPFYHWINYGQREGRHPKPPASRRAEHLHGLPVRYVPGRNPLRRETSFLPVADRRVRLLLVTHTSGKNLFGAERSFLDVCKAIAPEEYDVYVVIPTENPEYVDLLREVSDGVYVFPYRWWRRDVEVSREAKQVFRSLMRRHDIQLLYGNTIMLREPFLAARQAGIPTMMHVREIIEHDHYLRDVIGLSAERIKEQIGEYVDLFIANSRKTAEALQDIGETRLLYNTITAADFEGLANDVGERLYVGIVSSNIEKKGVGDFIELARLAEEVLPEAVFRVIGPETEYLDGLRSQLESDGAGSNIEYCGYQDSAVQAMEKLNVLVNFSLFAESFGRTVAEAMMAGRPAIVYDHGALPELVEHGVSGYVIPYGKPAAALEGLEELIAYPKRVIEMGQAGRKRAVESFDTPYFRAGLGSILSDVIETHSIGRARAVTRKEERRVMRVAYFAWHFPVPSETFVLNELRQLVENGHDVKVFCRQSPHPDFVPDFYIHWERVETPGELGDRLAETRRELVHAHFVYPTVTDFLWPACERAEIEFTFIAHAQDIFRYENDRRNRVGEVARSRWCKRVLVPGRFHRRYLLQRGVPGEKIFINPQGIDPALYPFTGGAVRELTRKVCCIQRYVEKKGILDLIRAAPALAGHAIEVHIYGYGPQEAEYAAEIERLGVANVHLHGALHNRHELNEAIASCDLFVTPCIRAHDGDMDGIPTVFMEAMALGTPVVTTSISSIGDLVVDGVNGFICEPSDPVSITESVLRYYAMPKAQQLAVRRAARRRVENAFDATRLLGRLIDLYEGRTVDIVIVSWNNLAELKEVVRRILRFTGMDFRLIINDNASDAPVRLFLERLDRAESRVTVVWQDENLYVGPGTNRAVDAGDSEYVIYVCGKEGFALRHNWERCLVEYMDSQPEVGLAGTLCYSPTYLTGADYPNIPEFERFRNQAFALGRPDREFSHVQGGLFILRRAMYEEIGGFNDDVPHSYTDVEYSHYVESHGWKLGHVPGMLALFNKTRPGIFSRVSEEVHVIHPPTLLELPRVQNVANGVGSLCPLCGWYGDVFSDGDHGPECPDCGSTPAHRSVWRFLAESRLTHRRLPALYVNAQPPLSERWAEQFQGEVLDQERAATFLDEGRALDIGDERLALVLLDDVLRPGNDWFGREALRVLRPGGTFVVRQPFGDDVAGGFSTLEEIRDRMAMIGFGEAREIPYESAVVRYDPVPLLVWEK